MAALISRKPAKAVATACGFGNSCMTAAVIMPSVPSAPINRFFRSYPVLSFSGESRFITCPSAATTSSLAGIAASTTLSPPALVERLPPICGSAEPKLSGNRDLLPPPPAGYFRIQPASTVMVRLMVSRWRIVFMRPSDRIMALPL